MVTRQLRWVFAPLLLLVAAPPVEAQDKTGWGVSATVGTQWSFRKSPRLFQMSLTVTSPLATEPVPS